MSPEPDLWLVGGAHDGLDHYRRARQWLRDRSKQYGCPPCFIAVEWDRQLAEALLREVGYLSERLRAQWPNADPSVIELGSESLCWEATAATGLFDPTPEIVWLDDGLDPQYEAESKTPKHYIQGAKADPLKRYLGDPDQVRGVDMAIKAFDRFFAETDWEPYVRERRNRETREPTWAERIEAARGRHADCKWAVALVGGAHATRFDEFSFPSQLDRRGIKCRQEFFFKPVWFDRTG